MKPHHILLGLLAAVPALCFGANIDRSTLTEVVNNVKVIEPASKKTTSAQVKTEFAAPNVLRTGADSRAEMIAPDQTVTRVGQNTIFSFSRDSREVELQKGSILFQSPSGKGGGTIRTPAASAAVLGTTLIVVATKNGGFKVLLVEGSGKVKGADGTVRFLNSGQLVYAMPGGRLSGVFEFRLSQQVAASNLVSGFKKKLPSAAKIQAAINKQEKDIQSGSAIDTGLLASGSPTVAFKVDVARDSLTEEATTTTTPVDRFINAATTDAMVNQSELDPLRVFVPEDVDVMGFPGDSRPFVLAPGGGTPTERSSNAAQFIGTNIVFASPTVSLADFSTREVVRFLSLKDIVLNQPLDLGSFPGSLQLWAGGTIRTPGTEPISLRAAAGNLTLAAFGDEFTIDAPLPSTLAEISLKTPFVLNGVTVENSVGSLVVLGGQMNLQGVRLGANGPVAVAAKQDLAITGVTDGPTPPALNLQPNPAFPRASMVVSNAAVNLGAARDIKLTGFGARAPLIRVNAGRKLTLEQVQLNDTSVPSGAGSIPPVSVTGKQVFLSANGVADLRFVSFASNDVLLQARTIKLQNVNFRAGSHVVLESQVGKLAPNPNTGRPAVPGFVNFIRNVLYSDNPAEGAVIQNGAGSSTPGSAGIVIRPRGK